MADLRNGTSKCVNTLKLSISKLLSLMVDSSEHHVYQNYLIFSHIFQVTLTLVTFSKVATKLKAAIPTELRVFRPSRTAAHVADPLHPSPLSIQLGLTGGQRGGCAQGPPRAGTPQLAARHKRRGLGEVKQSGGKVCREAPQRRSHRHLHSASVHSVRGSAHRPGLGASSGREEDEEEEDGRLKPVKVSTTWTACSSRSCHILIVEPQLKFKHNYFLADTQRQRCLGDDQPRDITETSLAILG